MSPVRVVVVDDSPTMRGLIGALLRRDPDIDVVGFAGDPHEARQTIKDQNPDVITLDIEMPNMNGLDFLERIMRLRPMPVVMVSTLTQAGAEATLRALELGAVDCIGKPSNTIDARAGLGDLAQTVKAAAKARVRPSSSPAPVKPASDYAGSDDVIAIGASTGGVEALLNVISHFPANCPPTVITQHMPSVFTGSFAARLDRATPATVSEAFDGAPLQTGRVYLAPGGATHLEVVKAGPGLQCRLRAGDLVSGHRPSVDALFASVASACGPAAVGAILTGMGRDGAASLKLMRDAGARTVGQNEESSVVYGMPRVAHEMGGVEHQVTLDKIGPMILTLAEKRR
ncbi:MAG: chemotaxis response regulator protein-glutamate methylesterase [Phenylobacterium sp.]